VDCRDSSPADRRDVLLSRELLLRQTILTSGVWLIFIGFGAYLNTGTPNALSAWIGVCSSHGNACLRHYARRTLRWLYEGELTKRRLLWPSCRG